LRNYRAVVDMYVEAENDVSRLAGAASSVEEASSGAAAAIKNLEDKYEAEIAANRDYIRYLSMPHFSFGGILSYQFMLPENSAVILSPLIAFSFTPRFTFITSVPLTFNPGSDTILGFGLGAGLLFRSDKH